MAIKCIHCGSKKTSKAGFTRNGKQRFYCRDCRRFSRENPIVRSKGPVRLKGKLPSKSRLVLELQAMAQALGSTPTTSDVVAMAKEGRCETLEVYYAVFSDFGAAIAAARLRPRYRQAFDKKQLSDELRALQKRLGRPLIQRDVATAAKKGWVSSIYHFQRAFGSVPQAVKIAGAGRERPKREDLIQQLRRLNRDLERAPRGSDITDAFHSGHCSSLKSFEKEFGTLEKARRAAGIVTGYSPPGYWRKYTRRELLDQLKALGERLGRKPTDRDINAASQRGETASAGVFVREFGSLIDAYLKAGFTSKRKR